jgi:transposase, IS30 family
LALDYPGYSIDKETIYRYIYSRHQRRLMLWHYLPLHRKRRLKKDGRKVKRFQRILGVVPISERPPVVAKRERLGDWESDDMEGKRSDHSVVSVTVERRARVARIRKLGNHTAQEKAAILVLQLQQEHPALRKTLTLDRGPENKSHRDITQATGVPVYFTNAYHAWEKGTVENTIGRIRRYIPRGRSVDGISEEYLRALEETVNNTPRKCLGFLTPNEALERMLAASYQ